MGAWLILGLIAAAYAKAYMDRQGGGIDCESLAGSTTENGSPIHSHDGGWSVLTKGVGGVDARLPLSQTAVRGAIKANPEGPLVLVTSTDEDHWHEVILDDPSAGERLAETGVMGLAETEYGEATGDMVWPHRHRGTVRCDGSTTGDSVGKLLGTGLGKLYP